MPNGVSDWFGHAGTLGYMAPEILLRQKYNQAADIFSLGALLFYLLTKRHLFIEPDPEKMKHINAQCDWQLPKDFHFSKNSKDIFKKTLTKDVNKRSSATNLLKHAWFK